MIRRSLLSLLMAATALAGEADRGPWVEAAARRPPMTVDETQAFMRRLVDFAISHHQQRDRSSPQYGMLFEYYRPAKAGQLGQWMQGEALDTMHDGAWFVVALTNAARATGDPFYEETLCEAVLPFYLKMLSGSDALFSSEKDDALPGSDKGWRTSPEWLLQGREKGFVPYWWDSGASVSLDIIGRVARKGPDGLGFPGTNALGTQPNPEGRLSGYSHGSSNHLAQDLGVMLLQAYRFLVEERIGAAARHLLDCRTRHGQASIPAVVAAAGWANQDDALLNMVAVEHWASLRTYRNHFLNALVHFAPGKPEAVAGFADDVEYRYYHQLVRNGTLTETVAWKTIFDALTEPQLYRLYSDDAPVPPGIGVFDLHPYKFLDGRPMDVRSARKGPGQHPRPIGSRFGPQNMVCAGRALQALRAFPGLWEKGVAEAGGAEALGLAALDRANPKRPASFWQSSAGVEDWLRDELGGGLRTWEAIFDQYGYLPTGLGAGSAHPGVAWDEYSDTGAYAHLLSAAAQWLLVLEEKRDWEWHP